MTHKLIQTLRISTLICSIFLSKLLLAGEVAESIQTVFAGDGYSTDELKLLHENHEVISWDVAEAVEQRRFGMLRTQELFPSAVVRRGGPVRELESVPETAIAQFPVKTKEGLLSLEAYLDASEVDGVIVLHRGKVIFERYPNMQPDDKHLYWSVSKAVLGTVVAILEDKGTIDLKAPIEQYIPELSSSDWKGTPVLDILDMASGMSGLELDVANPYTDPSTLHYQFEKSLGNWAKQTRTEESAYTFIPRLKRLKPSGQVYEYASVNSFVLVWLVQEVTGKPYAEVLSELIWEKTGAEADAGIVVDRSSGAPWAHGGIFSTLRDLSRLGLLFTPSYSVVSSEKIISDELIRRIQNRGRPTLFENRDKEYPEGAPHLGHSLKAYHWDSVWPDGDFAKTGFQGQALYISPMKDVVIALFSSADGDLGIPFLRALATSSIF
jgi:CubicO group peptidase (beta-lactamase class C family)